MSRRGEVAAQGAEGLTASLLTTWPTMTPTTTAEPTTISVEVSGLFQMPPGAVYWASFPFSSGGFPLSSPDGGWAGAGSGATSSCTTRRSPPRRRTGEFTT